MWSSAHSTQGPSLAPCAYAARVPPVGTRAKRTRCAEAQPVATARSSSHAESCAAVGMPPPPPPSPPPPSPPPSRSALAHSLAISAGEGCAAAAANAPTQEPGRHSVFMSPHTITSRVPNALACSTQRANALTRFASSVASKCRLATAVGPRAAIAPPSRPRTTTCTRVFELLFPSSSTQSRSERTSTAFPTATSCRSTRRFRVAISARSRCGGTCSA
mmetsp:Transcript_25096/g.84578  ORF Transcript_25096/g.84578 Transcript_25096/m.84578 type:complete len:218 (-) Transcript_25096:326-979(-)